MRKHDVSLLRKTKRAQGAIELLVLVSFFLLFSIPLISLIYLSATDSAQDSALLQARQACREIIRASDSVYVEGSGSSKSVVVVFPQSLRDVRANGREITFSMNSQSGQSDVVGMGTPMLEINGKIGTEAGPHRLSISSLGNKVEIKEG